jgi:hypothetical protein
MDERKLRRIIREEQERANRANEESKKKQESDSGSLSSLLFFPESDPEIKSELQKVANISEDFNSKLRRLEELTGKDLTDLKLKKEKPKNRMTLSESFGCFLIISMFAAFAIWIAWAIFIH